MDIELYPFLKHFDLFTSCFHEFFIPKRTSIVFFICCFLLIKTIWQQIAHWITRKIQVQHLSVHFKICCSCIFLIIQRTICCHIMDARMKASDKDLPVKHSNEQKKSSWDSVMILLYILAYLRISVDIVTFSWISYLVYLIPISFWFSGSMPMWFYG